MSYYDLASLGIVFRPIEAWPGGETNHGRRDSTFRAPWRSTVRDLARELEHLDAERIVLQAAFREQDIRTTDGMPRADRRALHPGVIVSFQSKRLGLPLEYATDEFYDWTDNLRAIALSMKALRAVDRYGVSKRGEQYRGWRQLPTGGSELEPELTPERAARIIAEQGANDGDLEDPGLDDVADTLLRSPELAEAYGRRALARTHPDRGGSAQAFRLVTRARETLRGAR